MKTENKLDFIVIGAMKCGTTSLHDILSKDCRIALPVNKEAPFFTSQFEINRGIEAFISHYYKNHIGKVIGKVTPHYMMWSSRASSNIRLLSPDSKIIALLRDPIDRLVSHYSMCVGLGLETRDINNAIKECLDNCLIDDNGLTPINSYVACSEYGRILTQYYVALKKENILILNFSQMSEDSELVVKQIYKHIGLPYKAHAIKKSYSRALQRGGKATNRKRLIYWFGTTFRKLFIPFLSEQTRLALRFKFTELKIEAYAPNHRATDIDPELTVQLKQHFEKDGELLSKAGLSPYWMNAYRTI